MPDITYQSACLVPTLRLLKAMASVPSVRIFWMDGSQNAVWLAIEGEILQNYETRSKIFQIGFDQSGPATIR